jgi:hypothetical protein
MEQFTYAIYLLIIGVLLGGYVVAAFSNPVARTELRRNLSLIGRFLYEPIPLAVIEEHQRRLDYVGRHHLDTVIVVPQHALVVVGPQQVKELTA